METSEVFLKNVILHTRDGDWGTSVPKEGYVPYQVIRGGDFPEVRVGDVSNVPVCYLREDVAKKKKLQPDDIVIETAGGTRDRPTGRTIFITNQLLDWFDFPVTCASFARFIRIDPEKADAEYVYWYLQYLYALGYMWEYQVQHTGIARFQFTTFTESIEIELPSRKEQEFIGRTLGLLDEKIQHNYRLNHTLEAMAQAIFKSWFVDFDPVAAKVDGRKPYGMNNETAALFPAHYEESKLGPKPAGWATGSIAEIADYVNGKNFTKNATGKGRMVIRIAELNSGPGPSTVYNEVDAQTENIAYPDDLIFSWSGSLDVYRWHRDEGLINQHIFKVRPKKYPQWFVHFHLREAMPFFQGIAADKATTMGHIKREHLSQAELVLPPTELLYVADQVIAPLYNKIHQNERESMILSDIRDGLLPKLLSGEIRVKQAEKIVEEVA